MSEPASMISNSILPNDEKIKVHLRELYGDMSKHGWRVRMRQWFGYVLVDHIYEATVDRLVAEDCYWIDVGGGKSIFPHNRALSEALASRAAFLVGVDPSDNICENTFVHERAKCRLEEYESEHSFDLATLRMVAEHIAKPELAVASMARLVKPGGRVVVYTPNRWSPGPIAAAIIPFSWHPRITNLMYGSQSEDVFPTVYQMNSRRKLRFLFEKNDFREVAFAYLDNCTNFQRFRVSCFLELSLWRVLQTVGIRYPENYLLGVYEKTRRE